jgi:lipopolysaccharide/colanic/teichoic acid biosynthesis glycosyltransferase
MRLAARPTVKDVAEMGTMGVSSVTAGAVAAPDVRPPRPLRPARLRQARAAGRRSAISAPAPEIRAAPDPAPVRRRWDPRILVVLDALGIGVALVAGAALLHVGPGQGLDSGRGGIGWPALVVLPVYLLAFTSYGLYARDRRRPSSGPVFFKQHRTGRRGGRFEMYKFRTMRDGADQEKDALRSANEVDGPLFKIRNDPRMTRVGRFLRATSVDELPQLLNAIKGEMSLVGPRPFVMPEADLIDGWAARRFDVRPGMTGLWQVSGRNDLPFEELRRLDYAYVASWSLWWDLRIMWHTPGIVLRGRGAY